MRYSSEAVIFDMDSLMIDTEPIYKKALQQAAGEFGNHLSNDLVFTLIDSATKKRQVDTLGIPLVYQDSYARPAPLKPL